MPTVETLEIEVKKSASDASNGISSLIRSLGSLKKSLSDLSALTSAAESIKSLGSAVSGITAEEAGLTQTLALLKDISNIDFSNVREAADSIRSMTGGAASVSAGTNGASSTGGIPEGNLPDEQVAPKTEAVKKLGSAGLDAAFNVANLGNALKSVGAGALKLGGKGILAGLKALSKMPQTALKPLNSLRKGISSLFRSLGRIAMYRAVRAAIKAITASVKEGIQNLARYSATLNSMDASQANATMSAYASTMLQVKNSIGAAVMPALTALLPLVNTIASAFITAANAVNQFLQALSGKGTFTKAKKTAVDYAKSLDKASGSAKELRNTLMGFDEINRLDDNSGSGGTDYGDMFEEATVSSGITDFVQKLKDALKSGEWDALMKEIADKFNAFTAKLLATLDDPKIKQKAVDLGMSIANALNALNAYIDWYQLGQALGAGIALALSFLISFVYTFDWIALGNSIAEMLNGMVSKIDWTNVGKLLWTKYKIIFEMLAGFIENLDVPQLTAALSEMTISLVEAIGETIKAIDWQKIGHQIAAAIEGIDFGGITNAFVYVITLALGAVAELCFGGIKQQAERFSKYLSEQIEAAGGDVVLGFMRGIVNALHGISQWVRDNVVSPFVRAVKDLFGIHSPSTVFADIGKNIVAGLLGGLKSAWSSVVSWWNSTVGSWISSAKSKLSSLFSSAQSTASKVKTTTSSTGSAKSSLKGITARASGGFVDSGQLFIAREAGAEMVGSIGRRTAVANNDQIVEGISAGVSNANADVVNAIFAVATQVIAAINEKDSSVYMDGAKVAARVTRTQGQQSRMYGR